MWIVYRGGGEEGAGTKYIMFMFTILSGTAIDDVVEAHATEYIEPERY